MNQRLGWLVAAVVSVSANVGLAAPAPKVAVLPFTVERLEPDIARVLGRLAAAALSRTGAYEVLDAPDVANKLASAKVRPDCDASDCLADVCRLTSADLALRSNVARLGKKVVIDLALFDARQGQIAGRSSVTVSNDENLFEDAVREAVARLVQTVALPDGPRKPVSAQAEASAGRDNVPTQDKFAASTTTPENPSTLVVRSSPDGAYVLVDGEVVGRAPIERKVEAGTHRVAVEVDGYSAYSTAVTTKPGETVTRVAGLKPMGAELTKRYVGLGLGGSLLGSGVLVLIAALAFNGPLGDPGAGIVGCVGVGSAVAGTILMIWAPDLPPRPTNNARIMEYERRRDTTAHGSVFSVGLQF